MKNIKNSKITKTFMYIVAIISMFIMLMSANNLVHLYKFSSYGQQQGAQTIYAYDEEFGTNYYKDFVNTQKALENNVVSFEDVEKIVNDNKKHSVHELLNINIDENINKGIRYALFLDGKIIGTDGITDENSYYNLNNSTIQNTYLYNSDYSNGLELKMFYEGDVAKDINSYTNNLNIYKQMTFAYLGCSSLVFLLSCLYFAFNAGKRNDEDGIYFNSLDKVYIDFKLIFIIIITILLFALYFFIIDILGVKKIMWYCAVVAPIITFMIIDFCSNVGKKLRVHKFLESISIIAFIKFFYLKACKPFAKFLSTKSSLSFKIFSIILIFISYIAFFQSDFASAYIMLLPFTILLMINPVRLVNAIRTIKNGKSYKAQNNVLDFPYNSAFTDIEEMSNNMVKVYQDGETAQKVKTELISNVSHDLRTPLTSIIGYVDLLDQKSESYDEETNEYIRVLKEKSSRMNTMVEDLFDLAKSVNNDVQMSFETINVKKLIEQSLYELDDVINSEKFIIKLDESLNINADGNKMYRVMQNLIENAVKYSFEGTRIYIDCFARENIVCVEFKNISNYQMDFTPDEIIQRFNRGDKSRTTKGSGLGLSIAKTYTNLNNGDFKIDIDGDMFKVTLLFDKVEF